jgi:hypothetical protein
MRRVLVLIALVLLAIGNIVLVTLLVDRGNRDQDRLERFAHICARVRDDVDSAKRALIQAGSTMKARGLDSRIFVELDACSPDFNDRAYEDAMNHDDVSKVFEIYEHLLRDTADK